MENNNMVKICRLFGGVKEGCSEQLKLKCRLKGEKAPASKGWKEERRFHPGSGKSECKGLE